jgi:glycosyltransferase 2 family protein
LISGKEKENRKKQIAGVIFSLLLTFVFLFIAFKGVNFSNILFYISRASITWILVLILLLLLSHLIRAYRWKIIIASVKPDASIINLFGALMVGYGVNCAVPRLGEISRAVVLGKWEKISRTSMLGTVIVERVIDILSFAIAVIISGYIYSGNIYETFPWLKTSLYVVTVLMIAVIIFLLLLIKFKERLTKIVISKLSKVSEKLALKLAYVFEMLIVGFGSLKGLGNILLTILLTVVILLVYSLNSYISFFIFGMENNSVVNFGMAWVVMSISSIGVLIPTPGGMGSYHTFIKSILVLLYGFGKEISLAYAVVTHIVSYLLFIFSSLFFFFWLNKKYSGSFLNKKDVVDIVKNQSG